MKLAYIIPRVIRHFLPDQVAEWMKRRQIIIKAGMETLDPKAAAQRYLDHFNRNKIKITDKTVLIFGYGATFSTACELLHAGAKKIILWEREELPLPIITQDIFQNYPDHFIETASGIQPQPDLLQIIHADITQDVTSHVDKVDLVISSSVFEHVGEVKEVTQALSHLTKKGGEHFHFVDLRDHYFKYPFEMLTFDTKTWKNWLNPTSNLNRYRMHQYEGIFTKYFSEVEVKIIESDHAAFQMTIPNIRSEFLSGDVKKDAATIITIHAIK